MFVILHKNFIYLIFFFFLICRKSNEGSFSISGNIGDTTFTISVGLLAIFLIEEALKLFPMMTIGEGQ